MQGHIFPPAEIDIFANAFHLVPRVEPRTATGNERFTAKHALTRCYKSGSIDNFRENYFPLRRKTDFQLSPVAQKHRRLCLDLLSSRYPYPSTFRWSLIPFVFFFLQFSSNSSSQMKKQKIVRYRLQTICFETSTLTVQPAWTF